MVSQRAVLGGQLVGQWSVIMLFWGVRLERIQFNSKNFNYPTRGNFIVDVVSQSCGGQLVGFGRRQSVIVLFCWVRLERMWSVSMLFWVSLWGLGGSGHSACCFGSACGVWKVVVSQHAVLGSQVGEDVVIQHTVFRSQDEEDVVSQHIVFGELGWRGCGQSACCFGRLACGVWEVTVSHRVVFWSPVGKDVVSQHAVLPFVESGWRGCGQSACCFGELGCGVGEDVVSQHAVLGGSGCEVEAAHRVDSQSARCFGKYACQIGEDVVSQHAVLGSMLVRLGRMWSVIMLFWDSDGVVFLGGGWGGRYIFWILHLFCLFYFACSEQNILGGCHPVFSTSFWRH